MGTSANTIKKHEWLHGKLETFKPIQVKLIHLYRTFEKNKVDKSAVHNKTIKRKEKSSANGKCVNRQRGGYVHESKLAKVNLISRAYIFKEKKAALFLI